MLLATPVQGNPRLSHGSPAALQGSHLHRGQSDGYRIQDTDNLMNQYSIVPRKQDTGYTQHGTVHRIQTNTMSAGYSQKDKLNMTQSTKYIVQDKITRIRSTRYIQQDAGNNIQ